MTKPDETSTQSPKGDFKLPRHVVPSRYELTLRPDLVEHTFSGDTVIEVEVLEPTDTIKVNAKELEIQEAYVERADGTRLNGVVAINTDTEIATITFAGILGAGSWKLSAKFTGILNDQLKGFYRSTFVDNDGKKHTIATTQFESTDARRAFPCFDEPEFKATWKVFLVIDENLTAISNGRRLSEEVLDSGIRYVNARENQETPVRKKRVEFAETVKMSSYLVAFIVGPFVSSKPVNVNGKEVRIWCLPGKEHLMSFALKAASFGLDWYEKYFDVPYCGGDKVDHIAIPDFAAGAMENLGCITYRETALLVDEKTAPHANLKRVAEVILHELAHMWFGDLVTMRWWNGLWLNESFATFMENLCLHHWKPSWNVWEDFALGRAAAARLDALKSTHPIECPVNHPDEVAELFDLISYEKGCSVLYQIHQFIGAEAFRHGIQTYLKRHAFGNTETHDLWDALEESCRELGLNVPVRKIMDAWVFTSGHPVVEVSLSDTDGTVVLTQRPFKFLPTTEETLWPIPVSLAVVDGTKVEEKKIVFDSAKLDVYIGEGKQAVITNAGGSGFYRVVYSPELAGRLTADLQNTLSVVERFNLVNDTWACVRARMTSVEEYLDMIKLFSNEQDPNVWAIILGSLRSLHRLVDGGSRKKLEEMIRDLVSPAVKRLGWDPTDGESIQTRELRGTLIGTLGTTGACEETQKKAAVYFDRWKADASSVEPNLVPSLVGVLAFTGDSLRYEEFFQLSKEAKTPQETLRFLFALARFRDKALLEKTLAKVLSEDVRTQDAPYLFAQLLGNDDAAEAAWSYLKENFSKMAGAFPDSGVVRMCGAAESLDTPALAAEVKEFFTRTKVKSGDMAVAQMLEQLDINLQLRTEQGVKLAAHLSNRQPVVSGAVKSDASAS